MKWITSDLGKTGFMILLIITSRVKRAPRHERFWLTIYLLPFSLGRVLKSRLDDKQKSTRTHRASAICSLCKIYIFIFFQIVREKSCDYSVTITHEKIKEEDVKILLQTGSEHLTNKIFGIGLELFFVFQPIIIFNFHVQFAQVLQFNCTALS